MHRIGTAGWTVPAEIPRTGSHLYHYARNFNCAEINSSFYRPHRPATWARWAAETPETFRFSVKAPKTITHEARLVGTDPLLRAFIQQLEPIRPKLGPVLFQLPPSLDFDAAVARAFFEDLRSMLPGETALEPRHASWFSAEAEELLRIHRVARVAADPSTAAAQPSQPGADMNLVYYRLHGSPRMYYSAYDEAVLHDLAQRVCSHPNVWVIFDNTAAGHAYPNALELQQLTSDT
jgi:uncharacterized protein YecE (DUF72 family)